VLGGQFAKLFLQFEQGPVAVAVDIVFGGIDVGDAKHRRGQMAQIHPFSGARR